MNHMKTVARAALSLSLIFQALSGHAQRQAPATRQLDLSAFAGATGTFTDVRGGKNLGITAGLDLTYLHFRILQPSLEVRGTYPIHEGTIDSQKNILVGPKVEHAFGRLHPYADFLIGRGEIDYALGVFNVGNLTYVSTISTVYAFGGGLDYRASRHFDVKGDVQYQHWDTPTDIVPSGTIHPVALTLGGVYHFDFNPRHHHRH
jgi:hypothetical protein